MAVESIRIEGLAELNDRLAQLPERIAKKIVAAGLRTGARVILRQAKLNAKRTGGSGTLYRAVTLARDRKSTSATPMYSIYTRRGRSYQANMRQGRQGSNRRRNRNNMDGFYGPFVEFGTRPHQIKARPGKALAFQGAGGMVFRRSVNHPGSRPRPYLGTAYQSKKIEALEAVKNYVRQRIDAEIGGV